MKKALTFVALFGVIGLFAAAPKQAEARPQYLKAFLVKYDIAEAKELKCGVCHGEGGKNKKVVSDYGKALGKALGEKNVKDADKIAEALGEAAKAKNGDDGSYGDLLDKGKLPPAAE
ncbi:hypothetical protein AB1L42_03625 [Thalassoglobus sp. JC818]|uniref:hypothetical protein n=1 Tax=Thalassoglobus sp. JC818 TaxID=3232136 RepID=UPI00345AB651